jgi:hypothetical protein
MIAKLELFQHKPEINIQERCVNFTGVTERQRNMPECRRLLSCYLSLLVIDESGFYRVNVPHRRKSAAA